MGNMEISWNGFHAFSFLKCYTFGAPHKLSHLSLSLWLCFYWLLLLTSQQFEQMQPQAAHRHEAAHRYQAAHRPADRYQADRYQDHRPSDRYQADRYQAEIIQRARRQYQLSK